MFMSTIEERIANVLRTARVELMKSEMTETNYRSFMENLLVTEGLVRDTSANIDELRLPYDERIEEKDLVWLMSYQLTRRLNVIEDSGVQQDYRYIKNTPLSERAQNDITLYVQLFDKLKERLAPQVRNKSFLDGEYYDIVREVGEPLFTEYGVDVSEQRRRDVLIGFGARIQCDTSLGFNIKIVRPEQEQRYKRNGLTKKQLTDLIQKADV